MNSKSQRRAPVGGAIGANGEFYEGGKFLPSTDRAKRKGSRPRKASKVEIEPYAWVKPLEGFESIYSRIEVFVNKGVTEVEVHPQVFVTYQVSEERITEYLNLYKQGYRFIAEAEPYQPVESGIGEYLLEFKQPS